MQESIASDTEIDEGGLDTWLDIYDTAFVNVADVTFVGDSLDIKLFKDSIFEDGNPGFLLLEDIDQHYFLHQCAFAKSARHVFVFAFPSG